MENLEGKVHSWGRRAREVPPGIIDLDLGGGKEELNGGVKAVGQHSH